jgi:DNA-binding NtrC family response regulator
MRSKDFKERSDLKNKGVVRPLRILICEPEEGNREVLYEALKKEHEIETVQPFEKDMRSATGQKGFDILIIDPEEKELRDLLNRICRPYSDKFWIIVTSDKDEAQLGLNRLNHNKLIFIPKPYDLDIIEKAVNKIAQWKAGEDRLSKNLAKKLARFLGLKF